MGLSLVLNRCQRQDAERGAECAAPVNRKLDPVGNAEFHPNINELNLKIIRILLYIFCCYSLEFKQLDCESYFFATEVLVESIFLAVDTRQGLFDV